MLELLSSAEKKQKIIKTKKLENYFLAEIINGQINYLPCRAIDMFDCNGLPIVNSTFSVYEHPEGKRWAITHDNGKTYVMFRNENTRGKYVLQEINCRSHEVAAKALEKEAKGYVHERDIEFNYKTMEFYFIN